MTIVLRFANHSSSSAAAATAIFDFRADNEIPGFGSLTKSIDPAAKLDGKTRKSPQDFIVAAATLPGPGGGKTTAWQAAACDRLPVDQAR
jgi:hypothetical protein